MNDLMSGGMHRLWKHSFINIAQPVANARVLDLAAGSGDIAMAIGKRYPDYAELTVSDINPRMLQLARDKLTNAGVVRNVRFVEANAEELPFEDNSFDLVLIAFGLRNVTHKEKALAGILQKLRSGGRLLILEFSRVTEEHLAKLYDLYSFNVIPMLGKWVANDEKSYRYLVESIRVHPSQEELLGMLKDAGFVGCVYHNMSFGAVAIHQGVKP